MIRLSVALLALSCLPALAHDEYTGKTDPYTTSSCCGGHDCDALEVEPGMLTGEEDGYRLRLTEEQARKINPQRKGAVDTFIPRNRIQPSWTGEYHLCIPNYYMETMRADFYCFWEPPNS